MPRPLLFNSFSYSPAESDGSVVSIRKVPCSIVRLILIGFSFFLLILSSVLQERTEILSCYGPRPLPKI